MSDFQVGDRVRLPDGVVVQAAPDQPVCVETEALRPMSRIWFTADRLTLVERPKARCRAAIRTYDGEIRCALDADHVLGGPKSHCANPQRGDGSAWTGPGFMQWGGDE